MNEDGLNRLIAFFRQRTTPLDNITLSETPSDSEKYDVGFSTIEVLVALVILSSALIPLMQVQINLQQSTIRLEQIDQRNRAISTGLKYIRIINPSRDPSGEKDLGLGTLYWSSELATKKTHFVQDLGSEFRTIGLFKMSIEITVEDATILEREIYQLGWSETAIRK